MTRGEEDSKNPGGTGGAGPRRVVEGRELARADGLLGAVVS
ncbi:hypothetical protein [Streptomyces europaeiscabiei]|nr:hypothetical protein [Streptomyces europaeiscabiei]MDX3784358.1 hypothetical protein [Streptomyces europaeiscabiei]